ncbi:UNVERIFIED_CONTAM: hypothetical protein FKN15_037652 [Acipenser sinensis]
MCSISIHTASFILALHRIGLACSGYGAQEPALELCSYPIVELASFLSCALELDLGMLDHFGARSLI